MAVYMKCPKCGGVMEAAGNPAAGTVDLWRCRDCQAEVEPQEEEEEESTADAP